MLSFAVVVAATALVLDSPFAIADDDAAAAAAAAAAAVAVVNVLAAVRKRTHPGFGVDMFAPRICFACYEDELYHLFVTFSKWEFPVLSKIQR